jgi:pyruvate/2-oxoglutarate dehydrogenase complex dihydrolipoamide acyltransferase (E2) component
MTELIDVTIPRWGMAMTEATLAALLVKVGDRVEAGTPLFELQTDKVMQEVPAPVAGIVAEILAEVDADLPVGRVVMRLHAEP